MKAFTDSTTELLRSLCRTFVSFEVAFEEIRSRSWASVTFTGARIRLRLKLEGPGAAEQADRFLDSLPDLEFELRGHIVADIALCSDRRGDGGEEVELVLEALTVEDC